MKVQSKLISLWGPGASTSSTDSSTIDDDTADKTETESESETQSDAGKPGVTKLKIKRKFNRKWMATYTWLRYESDEMGGYMYCHLCTDNNKRNAETD